MARVLLATQNILTVKPATSSTSSRQNMTLLPPVEIPTMYIPTPITRLPSNNTCYTYRTQRGGLVGS